MNMRGFKRVGILTFFKGNEGYQRSFDPYKYFEGNLQLLVIFLGGQTRSPLSGSTRCEVIQFSLKIVMNVFRTFHLTMKLVQA